MKVDRNFLTTRGFDFFFSKKKKKKSGEHKIQHNFLVPISLIVFEVRWPISETYLKTSRSSPSRMESLMDFQRWRKWLIYEQRGDLYLFLEKYIYTLTHILVVSRVATSRPRSSKTTETIGGVLREDKNLAREKNANGKVGYQQHFWAALL